MKSEQEQEQKQLFLRTEILDQNYSAQDFIDFLTTKKGESAADINNWTLDELKTIVVEFKSLNKVNNKNNKQNLEPERDKNNNKSNIFYNDELNNEWLFITPDSEKDIMDLNTSSISNSEKNKIIEIDCLEPDNTPLSKYEKITIKIS